MDTKAGIKTSEAWGGAAVVTSLITIGSSAQSVAVSCVCLGGAAVVAAAYVISRGLAKRG